MSTWTTIATTAGGLLTLVTAVINFATSIRARRRPRRDQAATTHRPAD